MLHRAADLHRETEADLDLVRKRPHAFRRSRCDLHAIDRPDPPERLELVARLASRANDRHGGRIRAGEEIRRDRPRCSRTQLRQIAVVEEQAGKAAVESAQHEHQPAVTHWATVAGVEIGGDLDGPDTILVEMAGLDVREALRVGEIERAHIRKRGLPAMKGTKGIGDRPAGRIRVDELTNLRLVQNHHVCPSGSARDIPSGPSPLTSRARTPWSLVQR